MNLELTLQEAVALRTLVDVACRSQGVAVAEAAVLLTNKINMALQVEQEASRLEKAVEEKEEPDAT